MSRLAQYARATANNLVQIDEEQNPMNFSQTFQLQRDQAGNYYVYNDLFKLVFG